MVNNPHYAGLRVLDGADDRPDELLLLLCYDSGQGDDGSQQILGELSATGNFLSADPASQRRLVIDHRFREYLSRVIARGLQLGITYDTMTDAIRRFREIVPESAASPALPIVGFEVEDTFETIYETDCGYLRVVEDDYSEELTADQLQDLLAERR